VSNKRYEPYDQDRSAHLWLLWTIGLVLAACLIGTLFAIVTAP